MTVTEKHRLAEVLKGKKDAEKVLLRFGIAHCKQCRALELETIGEVAESHGCDLKALVKALNELEDA
jgi:hybrid cluster-associated redox disulfide protein